MIYLQLFWSFFQIGLFTIGGGYASLPLIRNEIVVNQGWLTMQEYTDIITISQITPGPIAINSATFVGTQSGRFCGSDCCDSGYGHAFNHPLTDFGMGLL
ncbi:MAG: chromate transporter [Trichococcus flocculiformis]